MTVQGTRGGDAAGRNEQRRGACQPSASAETCRRCQSPGEAGEAVLLLGARDVNARATLVKALRAANRIVFEERGDGLLAVPNVSRRLDGLWDALRNLSAAARSAVRGAILPGERADCAASVCDALLHHADGLDALLSRAEHEWVREALRDDWLFSLFHPIVEARTGNVFAHEALIRARRPGTDEIIRAGPIIGACERLDLQHVLDQRARQSAIRGAARFLGDNATGGRVFINFLPNTIYDPEVCLRTTMETVRECGMDPARLVFEVVETEQIPDIRRLKVILDYYRARGVGTAVDDMGAGFSSLRYLTELRPNFVKLDRDLVVRAERGEESAQSAMDSIVSTAKNLNIAVVAEGIETREQRALCLSVGVDYLQGFLFARPACPPERVNALAFEEPLLRAA